jgi:hypothetical protein
LCIEKSALTDEVRKNEIPVKIKSFKEFFIENNLDIYISFLIKIDVEGFEKEVLHSLISFIRLQKEKYCVKIIVEILPQNYEEMSQFLKEHQITISQLGDSDDYVLTL